jgi:MFS family permease
MSQPDIAPTSNPGQAFSPSYRLYVLGLLTLVYVFNFLDRQLLVILQEPIKAELGLSDTQLGLLSGLAFAVVYATFALPIAQLAERWNRRSLISISLAVWSGMTALTGYVSNFAQLLFARAAVGIGEAGASPASHSIISDIFPLNRRATALAFYSAGINIGILAGFLIGGWINEFFGWRVAFVVAGVPGILLAIILRLTVREPAKGLSQGIRATGETPRFLDAAKGLWSKVTFRHMAWAGTLQTVMNFGIVNWMPSFMIRVHGMSTGEVGTWLALSIGAAGALGTFGGGVLADRLAERDKRFYQWVPAASAALMVPLMAVVLLLADSTLAMLVFMIPACLMSMCMGPLLASTHALADIRSKAVASAILFFITNLIGVGLGPLTVGMVSDYLEPVYGNDSLRWALLSVVVLVGLWCAVHYLLAARTFRQDVAQASGIPDRA